MIRIVGNTAQFVTIPFLEPFYSNIWILLLGGGSAFLGAYFLTFGVIIACRKLGWLDQPEDRRVHKIPVPRLGGVGIFLSFVICSLVFYVTDTELQDKERIIYWLFITASTLIVAVHLYDDVKGLRPLPKFIAQTVAFLIILAPWAGRFNGVLLFGFSNPFFTGDENAPWYFQSVIRVFIDSPDITWLAIPAVLLTWFWMVGMMNTVNFIDGVDGLATGVVGFAGLFITIISWSLGQNTIALLSAIFTGATFGFLPHNWNPAKIFMGDTGSQFLGLGLAVLSIMGGAKVALALMVLGIPILDVAVVMIDRIRQGKSPFHYGKNHLHHRFINTGLNARQICYVLYSLTILFGVLALNFPRIYKIIGMILVAITMVTLIISLTNIQKRRDRHSNQEEEKKTPPEDQERSNQLFSVQSAEPLSPGNQLPLGTDA